MKEMEGKALRKVVNDGKIITEDGFVLCPQCGMVKLLRLPPDGKVKGYPFCRRCKREQFVNIAQSQSL